MVLSFLYCFPLNPVYLDSFFTIHVIGSKKWIAFHAIFNFNCCIEYYLKFQEYSCISCVFFKINTSYIGDFIVTEVLFESSLHGAAVEN